MPIHHPSTRAAFPSALHMTRGSSTEATFSPPFLGGRGICGSDGPPMELQGELCNRVQCESRRSMPSPGSQTRRRTCSKTQIKLAHHPEFAVELVEQV